MKAAWEGRAMGRNTLSPAMFLAFGQTPLKNRQPSYDAQICKEGIEEGMKEGLNTESPASDSGAFLIILTSKLWINRQTAETRPIFPEGLKFLLPRKSEVIEVDKVLLYSRLHRLPCLRSQFRPPNRVDQPCRCRQEKSGIQIRGLWPTAR